VSELLLALLADGDDGIEGLEGYHRMAHDRIALLAATSDVGAERGRAHRLVISECGEPAARRRELPRKNGTVGPKGHFPCGSPTRTSGFISSPATKTCRKGLRDRPVLFSQGLWGSSDSISGYPLVLHAFAEIERHLRGLG
jgi:hypothetical protein